jgi:hypothetical protein
MSVELLDIEAHEEIRELVDELEKAALRLKNDAALRLVAATAAFVATPHHRSKQSFTQRLNTVKGEDCHSCPVHLSWSLQAIMAGAELAVDLRQSSRVAKGAVAATMRDLRRVR